jgi:Na+(H+)/acetate symporter ActP
MNQKNVHVKADAGGDRDALAEPGGTDHDTRVRLWVNWALALLTVVGAAVVMAVALGAVMSTAACNDKACPNLGPNGISFDTLFYGAPVVAAVAVVASFFTARRRWGFVIPVVALALLIADVAILVTTVAQ